MSNESIIFKNQWIALKRNSQDFYFLERRGKNSVAVFLIKTLEPFEEYQVLIRYQPLCIDNTSTELEEKLKLYPCPITGGIEIGESPIETARREVLEESGYEIKPFHLGRYIVGTQTNEICYMYYADVTNREAVTERQDSSYLESISKNEWHSLEYLNQCDYSACQIGYLRLKNILFKQNCKV